ncbi:hypothetical protein B484DRAFT_263340 [Ochromonadaceae sp. CCMP2298]|nr:hypothetical protein B484DRAFT_263340 [Ochromonadaceae sp. CCMP2298]
MLVPAHTLTVFQTHFIPNCSLAGSKGMSSTFNYISSVFWVTTITYQVWVVVKRGPVIRNMIGFHLVSWGVPLALTLLPLTTSTYDNPDDEPTWCFVADRKDSPAWSQLFWFIASFYIWLWGAMVLNAFLLLSILVELRSISVVPPALKSTVLKLAFYPVITALSWSLNTTANIYVFSRGGHYTTTNG